MGHVVFRGKERRTIAVTERLPTEKGSLEARIVQKFVEALRRSYRRDLTIIGALTENDHDHRCTENGETIDIQVTEVINPRHAELRGVQQKYAKGVSASIKRMASELQGLYIVLEEGYQAPRYPTPSSSEGKHIIESYRQKFTANPDQLKKLPPGRFHCENWVVGRNRYRCGFYAVRGPQNESAALPSLRFSESFPYTDEEQNVLLANTVRQKINKRYATPALLLAYHVLGAPLSADQKPEPFDRARRLLEENDHPFCEVWYFLPMAGGKGGCAYPLWPRCSSSYS